MSNVRKLVSKKELKSIYGIPYSCAHIGLRPQGAPLAVTSVPAGSRTVALVETLRLRLFKRSTRPRSADFLGETWARKYLADPNLLISMVGAVGIEPTTSPA